MGRVWFISFSSGDVPIYQYMLLFYPIQGGDFFQPLSFETRRKGGAPVDLFEEAFGDRPNLLPIIGSKAAMARASLY